MKTSEPLLLYTRPGCHLCELVEAIPVSAGVPWRAVDIDSDPALTEEYSVRIPVLEDPQGRQLFYPFDETQLRRFAGTS